MTNQAKHYIAGWLLAGGIVFSCALMAASASADDALHGAFPDLSSIEMPAEEKVPQQVKPSDHKNEYVREYSREEVLQSVQEPGNPSRSLGSYIGDVLMHLQRDFWHAHREGKSARNRLELQAKEKYEKSHYGLSLAAMKKAKSRDTDFGVLSQHMTNESRKSVTRVVSQQFTWIKKFEGGLKFDTGSEELAEERAPEVRYGLILEEIIPDMGSPLQASISDTDPLSFAGKAQVLYSIGPRFVEEDRRLFRDSQVGESVGPRQDSLWDRVLLPQEGFVGQVTPVNWHTLMSGADTENAYLKAELAQKEGYYRLSQQMNLEGDTHSTLHDFRVPLYRSLALGRSFDEDFHVERTSIHGLPIHSGVDMDFHYRNKEQRYEAAMQHSEGLHTVSMSHLGHGTGSAPESVAEKSVRTYMAEQYQLRYSVGF